MCLLPVAFRTLGFPNSGLLSLLVLWQDCSDSWDLICQAEPAQR